MWEETNDAATLHRTRHINAPPAPPGGNMRDLSFAESGRWINGESNRKS